VQKSLAILTLLPWAALAGCTISGSLGSADPATYEQLEKEEGWLLVGDVRHVEQETNDGCGAAALSSVLARWDVDVPAAQLLEECSVPGVPGLKAAQLRDAARRRGLSAYVFEGSLADVEHELRQGRPVMVGVIKSIGPITMSHFEVIVGLRPDEEIAAMDPARGLVRNTLPEFSSEWDQTGRVTLVVFRRADPDGAKAASEP
jgi:ABC-type bacteriocin/lantibiotic exporter with double-glycine peptidase domain